jgi:hypothetical protein
MPAILKQYLSQADVKQVNAQVPEIQVGRFDSSSISRGLNNPQVHAQALEARQVNTAVDIPPISATEVTQFSENFGRASFMVAENTARLQSQDALVDATNRYNKLLYGDTEDPTSVGAMSLTGRAAYEMHPQAMQGVDAITKEIADGLDGYARTMFIQGITDNQLSTKRTLSQHAVAQHAVWQDQSIKELEASGLRSAVVNYKDPMAFSEDVTAQLGKFDQIYPMDADKAALAKEGYVNKVMKEAIQLAGADQNAKLVGAYTSVAISSGLGADVVELGKNTVNRINEHLLDTDWKQAQLAERKAVLDDKTEIRRITALGDLDLMEQASLKASPEVRKGVQSLIDSLRKGITTSDKGVVDKATDAIHRGDLMDPADLLVLYPGVRGDDVKHLTNLLRAHQDSEVKLYSQQADQWVRSITVEAAMGPLKDKAKITESTLRTEFDNALMRAKAEGKPIASAFYDTRSRLLQSDEMNVRYPGVKLTENQILFTNMPPELDLHQKHSIYTNKDRNIDERRAAMQADTAAAAKAIQKMMPMKGQYPDIHSPAGQRALQLADQLIQQHAFYANVLTSSAKAEAKATEAKAKVNPAKSNTDKVLDILIGE